MNISFEKLVWFKWEPEDQTLTGLTYYLLTYLLTTNWTRGGDGDGGGLLAPEKRTVITSDNTEGPSGFFGVVSQRGSAQITADTLALRNHDHDRSLVLNRNNKNHMSYKSTSAYSSLYIYCVTDFHQWVVNVVSTLMVK